MARDRHDASDLDNVVHEFDLRRLLAVLGLLLMKLPPDDHQVDSLAQSRTLAEPAGKACEVLDPVQTGHREQDWLARIL